MAHGRNALQVDDGADYYSFTTHYQADFITPTFFRTRHPLVFSLILQKLTRTFPGPTLSGKHEDALAAQAGVRGRPAPLRERGDLGKRAR